MAERREKVFLQQKMCTRSIFFWYSVQAQVLGAKILFSGAWLVFDFFLCFGILLVNEGKRAKEVGKLPGKVGLGKREENDKCEKSDSFD